MVHMQLNQICTKGKSALRQKDILNDGPYAVYGASGIVGSTATYQNELPYVAVVKDGAGVGRASICKAKTSVLGTMQALLPNEKASCNYLLHLVRFMKLGEGFSGSTIPHIYFKDYGMIRVPVPPRNEQDAIVASLDEVESLIQIQKNIIDRLDELVKSRFIEMFGDPIENPKNWDTRTLSAVCSKIGSGATPRGGKGAYKDSGIPLIRSMNVHNGYFESKNLAYIDDEQADRLSSVTLEEGDVLLNITGASVARSCVLPLEYVGGRVNQHVSILRPRLETLMSMFLNMLLISDSYQEYLLGGSRMSGATREAITKQQLQQMQVFLPPLSLQQEFASFAQRADKLKFT